MQFRNKEEEEFWKSIVFAYIKSGDDTEAAAEFADGMVECFWHRQPNIAEKTKKKQITTHCLKGQCFPRILGVPNENPKCNCPCAQCDDSALRRPSGARRAGRCL